MSTWQRLSLAIIDLLLILASFFLGVLIRFEGEFPLHYVNFTNNYRQFILIISLNIVFLSIFGLYNKLWRYLGIVEIFSLFKAITLSFIIFCIPVYISHGVFYPRSVTIIAWLLSLFLLGGIRLLLRIASQKEKAERPFHLKKVLIVGAGDSGEMVVRELKRYPALGYLPVGIIDDDPRKRKIRIHGVPVLARKEDIPKIVSQYDIEEIIIALSPSTPRDVREIVTICEPLRVHLKTIPSVSELIDGRVQISQIREVKIEDLLERAVVNVNLKEISEYLSNKIVMITGAGGSIGAELSRQIGSFKPSLLILLGKGENSIYEIKLEMDRLSLCEVKCVIADIRDTLSMEHIFSRFRPQVVFHAAAHKHVPLMEENPGEAISTNSLATWHLAQLSMSYGVKKFIYISTDKSVYPCSIMGASKRLGELILEAYSGKETQTQFISVRFGNVLDSRGSVIPTFRKQIAMGGPVTVTHPDMMRYFMTIPEAVQLVLQAAAIGKGGEIFVLDMGVPIKIEELAKNMIRLSGFEPDKDIQIQFCGLRPGEKLKEEIITDRERLVATSCDKILLIEYDTKEDNLSLERKLEELERNWRTMEVNELKHFLMEIIPEYRPFEG